MDTTIAAPVGVELPHDLGGVQVYIDGIQAPISSVSPTEITVQVPWELFDTNGSSLYVRLVRKNGQVVTTAAVPLVVSQENPGIFAESGDDPRPGLIYHSSSAATGNILIDGIATANDVVTVTIEDRSYTYTVVDGDTNATVRDRLVGQINGNPEEKVYALPILAFTRIRLIAKIEGPEGNKIAISATNNGASGILMNVTQPTLCCANVGGARVTDDNPAVPGEQVILYATGLGIVTPDSARENSVNGVPFNDNPQNVALESVSSLAGSRTANVIQAALKVGMVGVYEVILELNTDIPTDPKTQVTISQYIYTSNIVTFPVVRPKP